MGCQKCRVPVERCYSESESLCQWKKASSDLAAVVGRAVAPSCSRCMATCTYSQGRRQALALRRQMRAPAKQQQAQMLERMRKSLLNLTSKLQFMCPWQRDVSSCERGRSTQSTWPRRRCRVKRNRRVALEAVFGGGWDAMATRS